MPVAVLVIGAILVVAGLVAIFTAPKPKAPLPQAEAAREGVGKEVAEVVEALNKLLDKFDKRLRLGVLLIIVGSCLVGLAGFLEAKQAKDGAKDSTAAFAAIVRRV